MRDDQGLVIGEAMARAKRLYDYLFSGNGYKVRLALAQLHIPVEHEFRDIVAGETRTEEFHRRNPMGQIPVLELDDGTTLIESNAILCWLTDSTWLMPQDRLDRAHVLRWMFFEQSNIDQVIGRARFCRAFPEVVEGFATERDFAMWEALGNRALSVLETHLASSSYLVGETYTAADICVFGYVHTSEDAGLELGLYPSVSAWLARVRGQTDYISITAQPE